MATLPQVSRREFLWTAGLGGVSFAAAVKESGPPQPGNDLAAAATQAYIWGFPLVLTESYLQLALQRNIALNQFHLSTRLSTPDDKVAGPNVDTLYGFAWLDLHKEPLVLHVPDTHDRYYSIQLLDAYANTFAYVGRRVTGTKEGEYAIAGPGWKGALPPGIAKIEAPTNRVLALARTLVSGEADLAAAQAIQLRYRLRPLSTYSQPAAKPYTSNFSLNVFPYLNLAGLGVRFFDDLAAGLKSEPPPVREAAPLSQLARIGVGPDRRPSQLRNQEVLSTLRKAVPLADGLVRKADYSTKVNGWSVNYKITNFIKDPLLRASVNRLGPGAHVAEEALYFFSKSDADGRPLSGTNKYLLRFPGGQLPPADAFWSLILYGPDFFLVRNRINRYSIGDRTAGLVKAADAGLNVLIHHEPPREALTNWLPAPEGEFQLILRTYQPRPALLNGEYKLPPIQRL